jgi:hypothetical protein
MAIDSATDFIDQTSQLQNLDSSVIGTDPPSNPKGVEMNQLTIPKAFLPVTEPRPRVRKGEQ